MVGRSPTNTRSSPRKRGPRRFPFLKFRLPDERTRGRRPADLQQRLTFNAALQRLAVEDAAVHQVISEVTHLIRPHSALRDPQIVERVSALMA